MELNNNNSEKIFYDYSDYPIYIHRRFLSHYPNYSALNHWHDDIELVAVTKGEMTYNVNGELIHLHTGEGIIVNSGQMHFGFSRTKAECDFICVLLHPMLLCSVHSFERDYILPFISNENMPYLLLQPSIPWQQKSFNIIQSFYNYKNTKTAPLKIISGFADIWAFLYENMPEEQAKPLSQDCELTIVKNMVGFIQKNYPKKITLADIACSGSVGQSKCCKLFCKYFSQSPVFYLNQYRLTKSIDLLQDTTMSIIEVSLSVGFNSASYYAEAFRKWTNKSPTDFQKQFKKQGI